MSGQTGKHILKPGAQSALPVPSSETLRQWIWPRMPPYNGFTHEERVKGWQCIWWLVHADAIPPATQCVLSGTTESVHYHCEDYYRPWDAVPLAQPIHFALHGRFKRPTEWLSIVERYSTSDNEWLALLPLQPVDIAAQQRFELGNDVTDVFGRAATALQILQPGAKKLAKQAEGVSRPLALEVVPHR